MGGEETDVFAIFEGVVEGMAMDEDRSCRIVAGVWERLWEEHPLDDSKAADRDALALWTQTPCGLYVDLRLPRDSPGRSLAAAAKAGYVPNPESLSLNGLDAYKRTRKRPSYLDFNIFMEQKSFAGRHLEVSPGDTTSSGETSAKDEVPPLLASDSDAAIPLCTCSWKRDIDYQPPSGELDIGVCASASPLESDGRVDLSKTRDTSHVEGWRRLAGTLDGPFAALELIEENATRRKGFWAVAGNRFAYTVGRPEKNAPAEGSSSETRPQMQDCVGMSLPTALDSILGSDETNTNKLALAWSHCAVAGTITENDEWIIEHSTNPNLVGCNLIQGKNSTKNACSYLTRATTVRKDIIGQVLIDDRERKKVVRRWKILEISEGFEMPCRGTHEYFWS